MRKAKSGNHSETTSARKKLSGRLVGPPSAPLSLRPIFRDDARSFTNIYYIHRIFLSQLLSANADPPDPVHRASHTKKPIVMNSGDSSAARMPSAVDENIVVVVCRPRLFSRALAD